MHISQMTSDYGGKRMNQEIIRYISDQLIYMSVNQIPNPVDGKIITIGDLGEFAKEYQVNLVDIEV